MTLFTSYLGFFNQKSVDAQGLENFARWRSPDGLRYLRYNACARVDVPFEPVFVMKGRGNQPVEPPEMVLRLFKEKAITWKGYEDAYLASLEMEETTLMWMQKIAKRAKEHNVVLVCFEKNPEHCHRRLLAEHIAEHYGVEYGGELE